MTLLQCGISCEQQSSKGLMSPHLDLWKQGHDAAWASAEDGCGRVGMCGVRSVFLKLAPRVEKKQAWHSRLFCTNICFHGQLFNTWISFTSLQVNASFIIDISEKLSSSDYIVILGAGALASIYTRPGQEDQVSSVCCGSCILAVVSWLFPYFI